MLLQSQYGCNVKASLLNIENEDMAEFLAYKAVQDHPSYRLATQGMRDIIDNGVAHYSGSY